MSDQTFKGTPADFTASIMSIEPVGSRVTCNPAPTDTDQDWLMLIGDGVWNDLANELVVKGWEFGGSLIRPEDHQSKPEERFWSWVNGIDNLIITDSPIFHRRFQAATSVAKRLNLLDKDDRIALFQAVLYGDHEPAIALALGGSHD